MYQTFEQTLSNECKTIFFKKIEIKMSPLLSVLRKIASNFIWILDVLFLHRKGLEFKIKSVRFKINDIYIYIRLGIYTPVK